MYVIYRDSAGGYRWRLIDGNRRIVADSSETTSRVMAPSAPWRM